jgi:glycosyltransferase involved in cell wall biosynthesis
MIHVAHITLGLQVGGQERLLVEMARNRDRERFKWTVIVLGPRGPLADLLEAEGVRIIALEAPTGFRFSIFRKLARVFREEHVGVVHSHDDRPLVYGMPAAWWAGVKRRVHTHHHGRLASVSRRQSFLIRQVSRFAEHFVCVSDDSARFMIEQGVNPCRVTTILNGIDLTKFAFQGPADDGPIVTVARLSPEKDVANLLRAAQRVLEQAPEARFEIAGDGPCRAKLDELARKLKLTEHVRFHGEVRDIPSLLARARLFVLPSQTEGISLTLLEAQARGLPVVATAVGGSPEVVEAGKTGLLAPARDPEALAQAILTLLADPVGGRNMGKAGRERVEKCFDIKTMTRQYESLYCATSTADEPDHACTS